MSGVLAERVVKLMEERGLTQAALARETGVEQPSINRLVKGQTLKPRFLHEVAKALGTTTDYLVGDIDDPQAEPSRMADRRLVFHGAEPEHDPGQVRIRVIDLALGFGANYWDVPVTEVRETFSRNWLREYTKADPEQIIIARGVGDSMMPTLLDSDLLIIDTSQQSLNIADKIWAIAYGEVGGVKRLRPLPGGGVQLIADNPHVPDAVAYDGELHILGRVVAVVRKM